uniref:Endonuclease/exonuclease/phosphatase domain-containing protein n=1 Tax=Astatotilapia calliptera TaxID=8154 RepID=A0AAX7TET7_ASTCA
NWCNLKPLFIKFDIFKNVRNNIETHRKDNLGHWLICVLKVENTFLFLCNVYGYNKLSHKYSTNNFIVGGDFNIVCDEWLDRSLSKIQSHHINSFLHIFCLDFNLIDPWRLVNQLHQPFLWFKLDRSTIVILKRPKVHI